MINVGLITSELKGLTNKLSFLGIECKIALCIYGLHYNVLLGLMTSVQEEV